jgi:TetR/AcrR family transcriptional repressor of nem operon
MRHKGVNKEETRQKMLKAVGRGFRDHGYAGIGVDGLAKTAGVTSGAFYAHFGSKGEAFDVALAAGLDEVIEAIPQYQLEYGRDWVKAFADYYLGKPHVDNPAGGCAMAALTAEVVRAGPNVHAAFEVKMARIAELVAAGLAGNSDEDRRARAWSMLGILIGGVNIARAMKTSNAADEIAKSITAAAIKVAGRARSITR